MEAIVTLAGIWVIGTAFAVVLGGLFWVGEKYDLGSKLNIF